MRRIRDAIAKARKADAGSISRDYISVNQNIILDNNVDYGTSGEEISQSSRLRGKLAVTVGRQLFNARISLEKSDIEKISTDLCIRPHLLMALEQDDFNKFPSACYASGFLKNYAAYLGLNVARIVAQYKKDFVGSSKKVDLVFIEAEKGHDHHQQMIISMVILAALVIYGVWYSLQRNDDFFVSSLPNVSDITSGILAEATRENKKYLETNMVKSVEKTPEKLAEIKLPVVRKLSSEKDQGFNLVQKVNAAPVASPRNFMVHNVRLSAHENAWIRITDKNRKILVDRVLLAGEKFSLANRKGLMLMTSNAGAISVLVGDKLVPSFGRRGQVRSGISLDRDNLLMDMTRLSH